MMQAFSDVFVLDTINRNVDIQITEDSESALVSERTIDLNFLRRNVWRGIGINIFERKLLKELDQRPTLSVDNVSHFILTERSVLSLIKPILVFVPINYGLAVLFVKHFILFLVYIHIVFLVYVFQKIEKKLFLLFFFEWNRWVKMNKPKTLLWLIDCQNSFYFWIVYFRYVFLFNIFAILLTINFLLAIRLDIFGAKYASNIFSGLS